SAAEVDQWVSVPNETGSRAVVSGIVGLLEARTSLVKSWYVTYLGRTPPVGDKDVGDWPALLASKTEEEVLYGIVGSTEYFNRAQQRNLGGKTPDENWVKALYTDLLGRNPVGQELDDQMLKLKEHGRQELALFLLQSVEYRAIVVRGYYTNLLG